MITHLSHDWRFKPPFFRAQRVKTDCLLRVPRERINNAAPTCVECAETLAIYQAEREAHEAEVNDWRAIIKHRPATEVA